MSPADTPSVRIDLDDYASPEVAGLGNFFGEIANSGKPPCGLATHRYLKSQPVMASGCSGRYATRSTLRNSAWFFFPT